MFVTNHVLSGVVIGRLFEKHPVAAFVAGVGSHLALDMVPHWGCDLGQPADQTLFLRYAKRDGVLGLATATAAAGRGRPAGSAGNDRGHGRGCAARSRQTIDAFLGTQPVPRGGEATARAGPERGTRPHGERAPVRLRLCARRRRPRRTRPPPSDPTPGLTHACSRSGAGGDRTHDRRIMSPLL